MKKISKKSSLTSALLLSMIATSAGAATLDYRHEYLNQSGIHSDRFKISERLKNNIGVSMEGKWTSKAVDGDSNVYDNIVAKGMEVVVDYRYKLQDDFFISPAVAMESNSNSTAYKFDFRGTYNITKAFSFTAAYKYGLTKYDRNTSLPTLHTNHFVGIVGYKFPYAHVSYEFEYKKTDYPAWKGREFEIIQKAIIQVPIDKEWTPYMEIGYVPYADGRHSKDGTLYLNDRQMRYRLGIKYKF
ncbi:oligogalacturonate-specific porin KdgM family protein [Orbaceae bacterium ESL0721]|nr:oligogalacturonate-specific porin KdgM family protein [Orbaceae bacterium ESL0721]